MEEYIKKSALVAELKKRFDYRVNGLKAINNGTFWDEDQSEDEFNAVLTRCAYNAAKNEVFELMCFLDTLEVKEVQEEPVSEGRDIFDNCLNGEEKFILPQKINGNIDCENCLYSSACALGDIQACIVDKPVSEDLEEAAIDYAESVDYRGFSNAPWNFVQDVFKAGAMWQKEQMMAKAIDGDITFDYYDDGDKTYGCIAHDSFCLEDMGLKDRDKVKIVVIK